MMPDTRTTMRTLGLTVGMVCLVLLLTSCNTSGPNGPVWLDDPVITTGLDAKGEPIDTVTELDTGVDRVYCFLRIRGPENTKLGVRWFYEDQQILQGGIDFGAERKGSAFLARQGDLPFPPGKYRCEIYAVEQALRTVDFHVKASAQGS